MTAPPSNDLLLRTEIFAELVDWGCSGMDNGYLGMCSNNWGSSHRVFQGDFQWKWHRSLMKLVDWNEGGLGSGNRNGNIGFPI